MTEVQHATHLKAVADKRRADDDAQILAWANLLKEQLYHQCELDAKQGKMYTYLNELATFIPAGVPGEKVSAVFNKVQGLLINLGYKVDVSFDSRGVGSSKAVSSIRVNWEESK